MRPACRFVQIITVLVLPALASCATSKSEVGGNSRSSETALDYYPLLPGWGWAYDLERDGVQILALYSVAERMGQVATIRNGDDRIEYIILPDGIARRTNGTPGDYLLRDPIRAGSSWPLTEGEAKVVVAGGSVNLPSGSYHECATIEESRRGPDRVSRTTYCKNIGPVDIEVRIFNPTKQSYDTIAHARLRGVTRPEEESASNSGLVTQP